ncbi:hypothetical protein T01_11453 [Trichinella spiralis]|uniref:Uncharacterized protein n=1 Tax=Trichinella spiralis TaxID=6334 RepID=A0A0V1AR48_TRISP|nr:hypothetical protein T01_11453 [Trichinella spiralis]
MQINNFNWISNERHVSIPFETELVYYAVNINGKIRLNVHSCKSVQSFCHGSPEICSKTSLCAGSSDWESDEIL